jgi:hypothetical protein
MISEQSTEQQALSWQRESILGTRYSLNLNNKTAIYKIPFVYFWSQELGRLEIYSEQTAGGGEPEMLASAVVYKQTPNTATIVNQRRFKSCMPIIFRSSKDSPIPHLEDVVLAVSSELQIS